MPEDLGDTVSVLMGNGDGTFKPQVTYAVGVAPAAIVAGDFNGDGKLDLAVANQSDRMDPGVGSVSVLLNNGNGTFQPQVAYPGAFFSQSIVEGDFTGNGRLDLLVGGLLLQGNGDGTFRSAQVEIGGNDLFGYQYAVAGDFNGDGKLDLAFANGSINLAGNGTISVALGDGDGTFASPINYEVGSSPTTIVTGDFNGSGNLSLATVNLDSNNVSVLLGNGDGTFANPGQFVTIPHATPLVADVNGDGTDDVLVVDGAGDILYRQGIPGHPGTFEPPVTVNPKNPSRDIAWVPNTVYGPVLASVDAGDDAVSLFAFRNGAFVRIGSLSTGQLPAQIVAADLNGDGWEDLVVRNAGDGTLSVYWNAADLAVPGPEFIGPKNTGQQIFGIPITLTAGSGVSDVEAEGLTGSGRLDLVVTNRLTGQVSIIRNLGGGNFAAAVPYRAGTGISAVDQASTPEVTSLEATAGAAAGPLVPGGPTDLITMNPGSNTLGVLAVLGGGRFANPLAVETDSPAQVVRTADFTGNGALDLAVLTADGVSIYIGNGAGGFLPPTTHPVPPESDGLTVADINHDGKLDLLVGDAYGDVLVLLGNGDGSFDPFHEANESIELAVADLNGNGSKDVIFADQGLDRVVVDYGAGESSVLANQSTGLLEPGAVQLAYLAGPNDPPDLIVANSGSNNLLIYPGLGNGQFGPAINDGNGYFVGTNPVGVTVADLTGGLPDLVVADQGSNQISILLNNSQGGNISFSAGPRLDAGGSGPVSTVVGFFTGGPNPDLLVTNSGSNNVTLLPGVGQGFFNDQNPTVYHVGTDPVASFVGNFDGKPDLVTIDAGSSDLSLISDWRGLDPVVSSISSGGVDPATAFDFSSGGGFDDLVVGNTGDGVLSLFEGSEAGLNLMSTQTNPNLPSPTDLAFSALSGGQVEFYAATSGREAASLVALSLSGETLAQTESGTSLSAVNNVAQLVPLQESSLALVASLLTLTVSPTDGEQSALSAQSESAVSVAAPPGSSASLGQSVSGQSGRNLAGIDEAEKAGESPDPANPGQPATTPWERFVIGLDAALEQFGREFQNRILKPKTPPTEHDQPQTKPSADSSPPGAPTSFRSTLDALPENSGGESAESAHSAGRREAVDSSIDSIWGEKAQFMSPVRFGRGAPISVLSPVCGFERRECGQARYFAVEQRRQEILQCLSRPGRDDPAEPSLLLTAATLLVPWTLVARPSPARANFSANFSPLVRRDTLAPISRARRT